MASLLRTTTCTPGYLSDSAIVTPSGAHRTPAHRPSQPHLIRGRRRQCSERLLARLLARRGHVQRARQSPFIVYPTPHPSLRCMSIRCGFTGECVRELEVPRYPLLLPYCSGLGAPKIPHQAIPHSVDYTTAPSKPNHGPREHTHGLLLGHRKAEGTCIYTGGGYFFDVSHNSKQPSGGSVKPRTSAGGGLTCDGGVAQHALHGTLRL